MCVYTSSFLLQRVTYLMNKYSVYTSVQVLANQVESPLPQEQSHTYTTDI